MKLKIGDVVIVKSMDFYAGIKGRIKDLSPFNHEDNCFVISIIDCKEFEKKYPPDTVGNNLNEVFENGEVIIDECNLELDVQWYRDKRLNNLLGGEE